MSDMRNDINLHEVTIANGAAVSGEVSTATFGPRGLAVLTPAAWTDADIAFDVSIDNSTWYPLQDDEGNRVKITSVTTDAAKVYDAPPECWTAGCFRYVRLASINTSTEADVNQGAARTCYIVFKR
jgi:hypothetical protein